MRTIVTAVCALMVQDAYVQECACASNVGSEKMHGDDMNPVPSLLGDDSDELG